MNEKMRLPRRRFDSASLIPAEDPTDLPLDPLPPEPLPGEMHGPAADAAIVIVPIGQIDERVLKSISVPVATSFGRHVILAKPLPVPKYAFNPTRAQYHSAAILKRVESMRDEAWESAIGLVDVDMFVPEVPFVFSEADRSTRSAVISLARLRPEIGGTDARHDSLCRRLVSEIIHQMGLIRGLAHCPNNRCVMFLSSTVQDTDKKGTQFCANCRKRLASESA